MTMFNTPWSKFDANSWWQACSSPWQAQSAYWQTVQTMMQQRVRCLQGMTEMNQLACQGLQSCKSPAEVAEVLSAWWGLQGKSVAVLNADTQSAANHLWEQWQKSFPQLDRSVWTQQYNAWQKSVQACMSGTMTACATQTSSATSSKANTTTTSTYVQPRGTFTRTGLKPAGTTAAQTTTATTVTATTTTAKTPVTLGPTAPGTAPRSVAKAPEMTLPLVNTTVAAVEEHVASETAQLIADNVTTLTSRTRMTGTQHAPLAAASASARRSVAARRQSKTRRVAR